MVDRNSIKNIIEKNALLIKNKENNIFFTSNDWNRLFDFRRAFLRWESLKEFSSYFWNKYESEYPFQIWWLELSSIPLIIWIVLEWFSRGKNVNSFFIRKERKQSWLWNKIEWEVNKEKIIIVDDLFNSWESIRKVNSSLKEINREICFVYVFVNFWNLDWKNYLKSEKIKIEHEFTLSDFWLDIFWHSKDIKKISNRVPVIYPKYLLLYKSENSNKFLSVIKSSPTKEEKNIFIWWEWWKFSSICSDTWMVNWSIDIPNSRWHKNILSSPIVIKKSVIFWSYDGNLYSVNYKKWIVNWKMFDADWIWSSPDYSDKFDMIYIWLEYSWTTSKWSLVWVDYQSWEILWKVLFDNYVHCSPWYNNKLWVVICWDNNWILVCVRGDTWKLIFKRNISAPIKWWFAFSDDWKTAYFWCFDNNLYSIDLLSWNINWKFKTNNIIYNSPLVIRDEIFIWWLDKFFYHISSDWKLLKKIETFWKIFSRPVLINETTICFWSNDSYIYFYDYVGKSIKFAIEHKERISNNLIYSKDFNHLYVFDFLNNLYKYDLNWYINQ